MKKEKIIMLIVIIIIMLMFVSCTTTPLDGNVDNKPNQLVGKVTAINGNEISLDMISSDYGVSDKTKLTITDDTIFEEGVSTLFEINDTVTFVMIGNVIETYPTKIKAKTIINIKKEQKISLSLKNGNNAGN